MLGPMTVIFPAWLLNIHRPMMTAMGIVMPIVKTPHGLFESALTTTIPRPASVTSRIKRTAIMATRPAKGLISVRANICQRPATVTNGCYQHGEVLHAPGQDGADQYPKKARRKAELRRQSGPDQRPRSRDSREVMPKEHPAWRRNIVMAVWIGMRRSRAAIVKCESFGGDKRAIETVGEGVDA